MTGQGLASVGVSGAAFVLSASQLALRRRREQNGILSYYERCCFRLCSGGGGVDVFRPRCRAQTPLRLLRKMLLHNELRHEDFFGPVDCFLPLLPSNCGRLASRVSLSPHISCFHHQVKSLVKTFDFVGTIRKHGRDIGFTQVFRHY